MDEEFFGLFSVENFAEEVEVGLGGAFPEDGDVEVFEPCGFGDRAFVGECVGGVAEGEVDYGVEAGGFDDAELEGVGLAGGGDAIGDGEVVGDCVEVIGHGGVGNEELRPENEELGNGN